MQGCRRWKPRKQVLTRTREYGAPTKAGCSRPCLVLTLPVGYIAELWSFRTFVNGMDQHKLDVWVVGLTTWGWGSDTLRSNASSHCRSRHHSCHSTSRSRCFRLRQGHRSNPPRPRTTEHLMQDNASLRSASLMVPRFTSGWGQVFSTGVRLFGVKMTWPKRRAVFCGVKMLIPTCSAST